MPWVPWLPRCNKSLARSCQDSQDVTKRVNPGMLKISGNFHFHNCHFVETRWYFRDQSREILITFLFFGLSFFNAKRKAHYPRLLGVPLSTPIDLIVLENNDF